MENLVGRELQVRARAELLENSELKPALLCISGLGFFVVLLSLFRFLVGDVGLLRVFKGWRKKPNPKPTDCHNRKRRVLRNEMLWRTAHNSSPVSVPHYPPFLTFFVPLRDQSSNKYVQSSAILDDVNGMSLCSNILFAALRMLLFSQLHYSFPGKLREWPPHGYVESSLDCWGEAFIQVSCDSSWW